MAKIIIPSPLRRHTDNRREIVMDAPDLATAMKGLLDQYQGLNFITEEPELLSVFVNGKLVEGGQEKWKEVALNDNDEVTLIIPIAGG
ncbi:MAG: MoaD/ThiS family protein [Thermodesulfobacteria bacterium]|nr:MoaD/ThiS family protein [Thermodesulfobacteriota bacterium]